MSITTEIGVDMMLGIANPTDTVKRIEKAVGSGVEKGLTGGLASNQKSITESYSKALVGALRLSNKEAALNMEREFKARSQRIEKEAREIQRREGLLERAQSDFIKKKLRERIEGSRARIREEQKALKEMAEKQQDYQRESLEMLDKGMEKAAKNFGDRLEDSVSGFQDLLSSAMGDPSDFIKKLSSSAKESSSGVFTFGAKMAAGGGKMAGMGKLIMGLGKLLPILAGVGAAVAGIVAVFMAAYGQAKEFNKTILEGSSAVDLLASDAVGSSYELSRSLAELRQGAMGVAFEYRATSEEVLGLATAMNDANLTFEEQRKVFGSQSRAMKQALVATQAFGVAGGEIATMVNTMVEDFAYGQSEIASGFQDIFGAAQMSGLGIKNFFTAISEATSGMALYNFRLEDTLELFVGLEKILGEDMGKDVLMGARDKFKEMGYQDRLGFRMKMGSRAFRAVESSEQKKATTEFNRLFSALPEQIRKQIAGESGGAIGAGGVLGVAGTRALGKMSAVEIGQLQATLRESGDKQAEELAVQLGNLRRVGMGGGSMMGEMGAESAFAADLMGAVGYLGDTLIGDMSEYQKMAFEQNQGISGSMLKAYEEVQTSVAARLAKEGQKATATSVGRAIMEGGILTDEEQEKLAKAQRDASMDMEEVARKQLLETSSMLDTMKNGVVVLLEGIYDVLNKMAGGEGSGISIRDARKRKEDQKAALDLYRSSIGKEGPTEKQNKEIARLTQMVAFEEKAYQGALKGLSRKEVFEEATKDVSREKKRELGVTYTTAKSTASTLEMLLDPDAALKSQEVTEAEKSVYTMSEDQMGGMLVEAAKIEADRAGKDAKQQVKSTDKTTKAVDDLHDAFLTAGRADLAKMLGEDYTGEISQDNAAAIRGILKKDGLTAYERERAAAAGISLDDFIYRGDGSGRGTIHPINTADDFYGAKPGGAIDKALRGGRGVTINNLIINESGNPQKTLQMVKQAIKAAKV